MEEWRNRLQREICEFPPACTSEALEHERSIKAGQGPIPTRFTIVEADIANRVSLEIYQQMSAETSAQNWQMLGSSPYEPFFIPASMLADEPSDEATKECALLQLPPEILTIIAKHVKIPHFQVCLALTCKTMGRVISQKNVMSPWRGYRDKDGLFRLLERKQYIPRSFRLCRACFRFMPWDAGYWSAQMQDVAFDYAKANWNDILSFLEPGVQGHHRCCWCALTDYQMYMNERTYMRDNYLLSVPGKNVICPSLNRRMEKP